MNFAKITGTGSYLPEKVVTNDDLAEYLDTSNEWIVERSGIHQRHIIDEKQQTVDMAQVAAERALEAAGLPADSLDLIIVSTATPDYVFPSLACVLQQRLGVHGCAAFDLQAACAGFTYGLHVANQFIRAGNARAILVVGAEAMSRLVDWQDRSTCVLFADGAGAVVLTAEQEPGILSTHAHADGRYADLLFVPNDLVNHHEKRQPAWMHMKGSEVFKIAVKTLGELVVKTLKDNELSEADLDWLIPHQANVRIIQAMAKRLKLPEERVIITLDKQGNTSSASIPLALDGAVRSGQIKRGDTMLLESFGGGLVWSSALVRY